MGEDATVPLTPSAAVAVAQRRRVAVPSRYRLAEVIGEGGMGRVYRAHDTTLGRDVAIKVIEQDLPGLARTQQRERFVREARAAARLMHPNIVAVHDVDPDAGWLVMDLVDGKCLREAAGGQPMPASLVRTIAEQVLSALAAAHAAGVIHRDVKPSNVILSAGNKATLVDFGVARLVDADMTRTGEGLGTPAYMAPEQIRGAAVDARTDLYALAATLYELVTGTRMVAFEQPGDEAFAQIVATCGGDAALARVIVTCLQVAPGQRFASAEDALVALRRSAGGAVLDRPRITPPPPRHRRWPFVLAAVGAIAVGAITAMVATRHGGAAEVDPRLAEAFTVAQRGENEKASGMLEGYLVDHPDDVDALTLSVLVEWWTSGAPGPATDRALAAHLRPEQRALVHGVQLIVQRRETEAIGYLEAAEREQPDRPEILYALGEARWHGQRLEDGASTLERAFRVDPRWEMALHHVVEFRLTRGEASRLDAIADKLATVDPPASAALGCKILIGERKYGEAVEHASAALASTAPGAQIPELYICKAQAQALVGDLAGGEVTAKTAFELWPIDVREWGGFAQYAEFLLYRGKLDDYLALLRNKPSRQRTIALAVWRPSPDMHETPPTGPGMRMPPLGAATYVLVGAAQGRDEVAVYGDYPEPEVRYFGKGLAAEAGGKSAEAIEMYRKALDAPAKGDARMMIAHALAAVLYKTGDGKGATAACEDVIAPRLYDNYRAVLLPDCLAWSDDAKGWQHLVDTWVGFDLPAVALARHRLELAAGKPAKPAKPAKPVPRKR